MGDASSLETVRKSDDYKVARARLADREWRLDNLYTIKNKDGIAIPFKRNHAQVLYSRQEWFRDTILKSRKLGFCHDPSMRVLTADLRWVTVDDLAVGQEIVSVDENIPGGKGHHRRMRRAVVQFKRDVFEVAYRLTMSNGEVLIATGQHRYLCKKYPYEPTTVWRQVDKMRVGEEIRTIAKTWGDSSFEDGWMGGFIDGEGSFSARTVSAGLNVSQTDNAALERAKEYLTSRGYAFRIESDPRKKYSHAGWERDRKPLHKLCIGRINEIFRILGQCRPARFAGLDWWEGRELPGKKSGDGYAAVVAIENLGVRRMVDIQTSTKTFICEGFVSHNSTYIAIEMLDACLFASNTIGGIIDLTLDDATSKLAILKFAYDRLKPSIRGNIRMVRANDSELQFSNGSRVVAGTSYRGDTPQLLHVSEFGPISAKNPQAAKEIKVGSFPSVPQTGKIWVESTPMGTSGEFFDLVKAGEQLAATGQRLTPLDFKLHFFGWYNDPDNRLPINLVHIPADMHEYFDELKVKHGIVLDGLQKAWYTKTREFLGPDDVKSEHPSTADECFFASLEGAYFKNEMNKARRDGRVGKPVSYDDTRPVHTFWDLGMDGNMAIGFMQTDGVRHRVIDFARGDQAGLMDGIRILKDKSITRGFTYGKHYGPHDLQTRDWSNMNEGVTAQTRKEVAAEHGIDFTVVGRVGDKQDSIEAGRRLINNCWFCSEYAGDLVECLDNYTRGWNKTTLQWMAAPAKNGFDHGADAFQQVAMGLQPDVVSRRDQISGQKRKGSFWSQ